MSKFCEFPWQKYELTSEEVDRSTTKLINQLTQNKILSTRQSMSWWCDTCQEEHKYNEFDGELYKICDNDADATLGEPIDEAERTYWSINWQKLIEIIKEKNNLSLCRKEDPADILLVGESGRDLLVFVAMFSHGKDVSKIAKDVHYYLDCDYDQTIVISTQAQKQSLSNAEITERKRLEVEESPIEELIEKDFVLRYIEREEKRCISILNKDLKIGESKVRLVDHLLKVARVLVRARGETIPNKQLGYEDNARSIISELNKTISEVCPECSKERRVFISTGKGKYKLNTDFYTC